MNQPLFTGACTALVTPFIDGKVNYPMVEQLLRRQHEAGIRTVVLSGTTGEASTLSDREKVDLIHCARDAVGKSMTLIAGSGSNNTQHAVELSQMAQEAGADALLVVTPYYNKATPDGLFGHYLTVAHAVTIPIVLYNVPSRTGMDISVPVYRRLSRIPNIVGVKEASTDITKIAHIRKACGPGFSIWSGNDDLAVPAMALGAAGVISVVSNVEPAAVRDMADAALAGDFDTAASLHNALLDLMELMFCEVNPVPVKAAMRYKGYDCGGCRLPLTTLAEANQQRLAAYFSNQQ